MSLDIAFDTRPGSYTGLHEWRADTAGVAGYQEKRPTGEESNRRTWNRNGTPSG